MSLYCGAVTTLLTVLQDLMCKLLTASVGQSQRSRLDLVMGSLQQFLERAEAPRMLN